MEEKIIYITSKEDLKDSIREVLSEKNIRDEPEFEKEKLTRTQAAKLAGVSLPTFSKMIKARMFPEHGFGRKIFYLKSQVIEGLKHDADKNVN